MSFVEETFRRLWGAQNDAEGLTAEGLTRAAAAADPANFLRHVGALAGAFTAFRLDEVEEGGNSFPWRRTEEQD